MQKYRPKTLLAGITDRIFRVMAACGAGMAWFISLWGVTLPALTAGIALGGLLWLCVRQFTKRSTQKREKQMRRLIGGELALNRLLLLPSRHAAFQTALWIAPRYPLDIKKAVDWCVTGTLDGKNTVVRLICQHESMTVSVQQVVECVREAMDRHAQRCILCLTAPASKEALLYAANTDPPMEIVSRQELINLAGLHSPATDEDLSRLGKQKQVRHSAREWLAVVLDASRARRYFWYGAGLSALAALTRLPFYPIPAAVCLGLFIACKLRMHWQARSTP